MKILGVVIAGGASTRMGGIEKAFISLDGVTLIERVLSRLRFQVDDVVVNANGDAARFSALNVAVVADHLQNIGTPLAGLHAALAFAAQGGFDACVTVPSDSPLIPLDLVERLLDGGEITGAAIATSLGQEHYLTGIWTTALAQPLERLIIHDGLRRVQDFVAKSHAAKIGWAADPHDPFFNINTPEDLTAAEQIVRGEV